MFFSHNVVDEAQEVSIKDAALAVTEAFNFKGEVIVSFLYTEMFSVKSWFCISI